MFHGRLSYNSSYTLNDLMVRLIRISMAIVALLLIQRSRWPLPIII